MSFLLDPSLLLGTGVGLVWLYNRKLAKRNKDWLQFLGALTVIAFYLISVPLYLGLIPNFFAPGMEAIMGPGACGDGPTFMWNSCLPLGIAPSKGAWPLALVIFLSYPLWLYVGVGMGKALFGQTPKQKGFGALRF